jgi:hypothetical protein
MDEGDLKESMMMMMMKKKSVVSHAAAVGGEAERCHDSMGWSWRRVD